MITSLNAARKRRNGLADTGRCMCGRYRMFCNGPLGCLETAEERDRERREAAEKRSRENYQRYLSEKHPWALRSVR